jgi:hypothetical protein
MSAFNKLLWKVFIPVFFASECLGFVVASGQEILPTKRNSLQLNSDASWHAYAENLFFCFDQFGGDQAVANQFLPDDGMRVALRADEANEVSFGPRITIGKKGINDQGWEASYFELLGNEGSTSVYGDGDLALPGDLGLSSINFFKSDQIRIQSEKRLHNFEISRTWHADQWSFLTGFRYLRLDDELTIASFDLDNGGESFGKYDIATKNNLFGLQVGASHQRRSRLWRELHLETALKGGIYCNSARQSQSVVEIDSGGNPFYLRDPFIGDASINLLSPLSKRISIRGGYNMLILEGIGWASDQLDYRDTTSLQTSASGGGIIHGANLGLCYEW